MQKLSQKQQKQLIFCNDLALSESPKFINCQFEKRILFKGSKKFVST